MLTKNKKQKKTRKKDGGCISVKVCHFEFASYTLPMNIFVSLFVCIYIHRFCLVSAQIHVLMQIGFDSKA